MNDADALAAEKVPAGRCRIIRERGVEAVAGALVLLGVILGVILLTVSAGERRTLRPATAVNLGGGVTMRMVLIPSGTFTMSSPPGEKDRDDDEVDAIQ
jgi:formylglycine-generating enzyme required for sulfatase activity